MVLPEELERQFEQTLLEYEEEKKMQYITSIERSGIQKGLQQGIEQGIEQGLLKKAREDVIEVLEIRFGSVPEALVKVIDEVNDSSVLKTLLKQAVTSESLAEFQAMVEAEQSASQTVD